MGPCWPRKHRRCNDDFAIYKRSWSRSRAVYVVMTYRHELAHNARAPHIQNRACRQTSSCKWCKCHTRTRGHSCECLRRSYDNDSVVRLAVYTHKGARCRAGLAVIILSEAFCCLRYSRSSYEYTLEFLSDTFCPADDITTFFYWDEIIQASIKCSANFVFGSFYSFFICDMNNQWAMTMDACVPVDKAIGWYACMHSLKFTADTLCTGTVHETDFGVTA